MGKCVRAQILALGLRSEPHQLWREMKNAVRVEIGVSRVESQAGIDVAWWRRGEAEIFVPVVARECSYCRPGSTNPALDEEIQELRDCFAFAFEILEISVAIHSKAV